MVDAAGTTLYAYAAGGQLWTEDGPWSSDTVTNTYSYRMRTGLSLAQPTGKWTNSFGYDAARRLTGVTSPAGTFTYTLAAASAASPLPKKVLLPNTSYITNTYDTMARLKGTYLDTSANVVTNKHEYAYNVANQRINSTNLAGTYYTNSYDKIGQLKVADSSVNTEDRGYLYDAAWNLNKRTNNGTVGTFTVDNKNQLTQDPAQLDSYDNNGNLVSRTGGLTYSYDDENRLTSLNSATVYRSDFVYDGKGRLRTRLEYNWIGAWSLFTTTCYVYDGMRVIQERNVSNVPQVSYTRGSDLSGSLEGAGGIGGLLSRSHAYQAGSGNWTNHNFYHADGNGNVTYMLNSSQTKVAEYRYDPFGITIASSGTLSGANMYRFSSKEVNYYSGMYYYGYRFYYPTLQRWLNRDPLGEPGFELIREIGNDVNSDSDGPNLYTFVRNNPNGIIDTDGLSGTIAIPILVQPRSPNPINLAFCAGAAAGTALCLAFPDTMTKPGEWIGNLICPMSNSGERGIQGKDPNPWKGWRPNPKRPGSGWKTNPQTGKDIPKPRPPGPPPPNHPDW